jgi:hypothetical protein
MTEGSGLQLAGFGQLAGIGLAIVALYAFLQDFMSPDWPAWILSPMLLIGFRGAIYVTREDSVARAALWQGALLIMPFTAIYGLLDVLFSSDRPVWLLSSLIVIGLWLLFFQVVEVESE